LDPNHTTAKKHGNLPFRCFMLQPFLFNDPSPSLPRPLIPDGLKPQTRRKDKKNPFRQIGGFSGQVSGKTADLLSKDDTSCPYGRYANNVSVNTIEFPILYCTLFTSNIQVYHNKLWILKWSHIRLLNFKNHLYFQWHMKLV
jgi:hypothetical protein